VLRGQAYPAVECKPGHVIGVYPEGSVWDGDELCGVDLTVVYVYGVVRSHHWGRDDEPRSKAAVAGFRSIANSCNLQQCADHYGV